MDLWKLVSMLEHRALYFPVIAELNDGLEAVPLKLPHGSTEQDRWQQWHFWMLWRSTFFASCWHCAADESASMWGIYGGSNQGLAIRSTFQNLSDAFPPAGEDEPPANLIKGGLVEYVGPDSTEPMFRQGNGYPHVFRKRSWFVYEQELRVTIERAGNFIEPKGNFDEGYYERKGTWVRCDLGKLIQGVVVAPKSPKFYKSAVQEVLKRFDIDPELVKESRLNDTFVPPDPLLVREEWDHHKERKVTQR